METDTIWSKQFLIICEISILLGILTGILSNVVDLSQATLWPACLGLCAGLGFYIKSALEPDRRKNIWKMNCQYLQS